ncbi:MAG: hypothetical protein ACP5VR_05950 [Acidimicrobiales bacterium]
MVWLELTRGRRAAKRCGCGLKVALGSSATALLRARAGLAGFCAVLVPSVLGGGESDAHLDI